MLYAERIESSLRHENTALRQELRDSRLDLDDAAKSRRELQQRLLDADTRMGYISQDNDNLKVNPCLVRLTWGFGPLEVSGIWKPNPFCNRTEIPMLWS